ncbi:MAG: Flp pilus assembly complex ATPase component TadA [Lentisphaeria bacterium]|nr:Flp pilus assembly complex ATPase component TadA [Lentisphaeria bacterium]
MDFRAGEKALAELLAPYEEKIGKKRDLLHAEEWDRELIHSGIISESDLVKLYSQAYGTPVTEEEDLTLPDQYPDAPMEYFNAVPALPFLWDDDTVTYLVCSPAKLGEIALQTQQVWQKKANFLFVRRTFLERLLSTLMSRNDEDETANLDAEDENTLRTMAGEARIVRLVNDIFTRSIELGASDIHIEPGDEYVSVRCRVDGVLTEIMTCPLAQFPAIASRVKLIGKLNIAESRLPQDGRADVQLNGKILDMRISTLPILTGESIVLRLLNHEAVSFNLQELGMFPEHLAQFHKLINIPHGMILVVGPTGSGKTTTLYSVINSLNDRRKKIITIEDPVEYKTEGLCQCQVNPKIGVTFAEGLRNIVRQDPDIILVGEIRDRETADIAINAALTGHLVLSTLHTNDAVGAVTRLVDMGVENFLVSSALFGVLSQRLVRKICKVCNGTGKDADGQKCRRCNGTGYKGRSGIFELLFMDEELRQAVNRNASSSELESIAEKHGMVTLKQDGIAKVKAGITTEEELNRSTANL